MEEWKDCEELKSHPKEKWIFADKNNEVTKHQTEWRATAGKYRCMQHVGEHDMARRMDGQGESVDMLQKMLSLCATKNGTKIDEPLQAGERGHKRTR